MIQCFVFLHKLFLIFSFKELYTCLALSAYILRKWYFVCESALGKIVFFFNLLPYLKLVLLVLISYEKFHKNMQQAATAGVAFNLCLLKN